MGFLHFIAKLLNFKKYESSSLILSAEDLRRFSLHRCKINTLRTVFISAFLAIEQFLFGILVAEPNTLAQRIFFISSLVMLFFLCISLFLYKKKAEKVNWFLTFFSNNLAYVGLTAALYRTLIFPQESFSLPTIYLAVNYAIAVIFYFTYIQATVMYALFAFFSIYFMKILNISPDSYVYIGDVISNVMIAWIIAVLNYHNLYRDFSNQIIIKKANDTLIEKNEHIQVINNKLTILSEHDSLTGIFNRRKIDQLLSEEWKRFERYGRFFSIIILDVDLFKQVNDTYGHVTGDAILKEFTKVLESQLRSCDCIGRWGGEEFFILCKETNIDQAGQLARRLQDKLNNTAFEEVGTVTASFGVACVYETSRLESLITLADKRLYVAKTSGRNRVISTASV